MAEHQALYATDEVRDPVFETDRSNTVISTDDRLSSSVNKGGRFEHME